MRTVNSLQKLKKRQPSLVLLAALTGTLLMGMNNSYAQVNGVVPFIPPAAASPGGAPPPMPNMAFNAMAPGAEMDRNVTGAENKVTENAKSLIKNLDASTDALTLEDLNSARQTVARIDAIIEIEKHLAELEKVRNDRTGASKSAATSLASVIPASALTPPPAIVKPVEVVEREPARPVPSFSNMEISRIMGSEGKYTAVIKINGDLKTVRIGDELPGNEVVRYISSSSVVIDQNGRSKTLHIKNVDAIYSAMR